MVQSSQPAPKPPTSTFSNNKIRKSKSKSTPKQSSSSSRCWDWILTGGNTHYAKNRSSFLTYRRAPGKIANNRVLGIGTVQLRVKRAPDDDRPDTLTLEDVLHMPDARCNGLSLSRYRGMNPGVSVEDRGGRGEEYFQAKRDNGGEGLWYGEEYCGGLSRVVLWGDPRGETYLRNDGRVYLLSVIATGEEMESVYARVRERDF